MLDEDKAIAAAAAAKKVDEAALLLKASDYIVDVGNKISGQLSDRYRVIAKEIAGKVKNFQGKNIRSYDDAMKTLNRLNSNPSMRISPADKAVLINAWRQVNAQNMSINLASLSKVFTTAGWLLRVEKVREKSIVGYETGNWGPLILEVESWVLSGVVASVAMATLGIILSMFAISSLFTTTLIMIVVTLIISYLASLIDDSVAERINNELIKAAH
nr:colicin-like pore-forming protein [Leclercia tamurae]